MPRASVWPGLPLAIVPTPLTNQQPEDIHRMVDAAFDEVVAGLTKPVEPLPRTERPASEERLAYDGGPHRGLGADEPRLPRPRLGDGLPLTRTILTSTDGAGDRGHDRRAARRAGRS